MALPVPCRQACWNEACLAHAMGLGASQRTRSTDSRASGVFFCVCARDLSSARSPEMRFVRWSGHRFLIKLQASLQKLAGCCEGGVCRL